MFRRFKISHNRTIIIYNRHIHDPMFGFIPLIFIDSLIFVMDFFKYAIAPAHFEVNASKFYFSFDCK